MQPWSHSNLISRCGTARVPHKHNCLLGTMISNEMRLHQQCNLSGKISTREWVPVPGVFSHIGSSMNSPSLSPWLLLSLSQNIFSPSVLVLLLTYGDFILFKRVFPQYLMLDRVSVKAVMITVNSLIPNGTTAFHLPCLFSSWLQNPFTLIFKVEKCSTGWG